MTIDVGPEMKAHLREYNGYLTRRIRDDEEKHRKWEEEDYKKLKAIGCGLLAFIGVTAFSVCPEIVSRCFPVHQKPRYELFIQLNEKSKYPDIVFELDHHVIKHVPSQDLERAVNGKDLDMTINLPKFENLDVRVTNNKDKAWLPYDPMR